MQQGHVPSQLDCNTSVPVATAPSYLTLLLRVLPALLYRLRLRIACAFVPPAPLDCLQVIRYTLQGVPGHYVVSTKVEYKSLHRSQAFTRIQLTGEGGRRSTKRRKKM